MYSSMALKLSELSMASPKPGVSTTVSLNLTPRSSISTVEASNFTVCFCFSIASGIIRSGYKSVKNRLLTSVDLPKPDSPTTIKTACTTGGSQANALPGGVYHRWLTSECIIWRRVPRVAYTRVLHLAAWLTSVILIRDISFSSIPLKVSLDISLTFFNTTSVECLHQLTIAKKRNENTFARLQNG
ncbi:hypothetical protein GQX74_008618 [Glossina fuscipes]|nr:hypothetical protein GQX74_008618 [Glossina fuscipes]